MVTLWHDLRYSLRALRKRPGFTSAVIATGSIIALRIDPLVALRAE